MAVAFVLVLGARLVAAQDGWLPTGSLNTQRTGHTATLLPNGKVLVAGGLCCPDALASAELYDPMLGTWANTGSLNAARARHKAVLLPNGKVLVAGGSASNRLSSAELYEPANGTWTPTGSMTKSREGHTMTLLPNGKVLVVGGVDSLNVLASAELYDPALGTWAATGSMISARSAHTASLLANGKVLVCGGSGTSGLLVSSELYNPSSGTWTTTGSLSTARFYHVAAVLQSGKVLVAGGLGGGGGVPPPPSLPAAEVYDPASGAWTTTGPLAQGRVFHTMTVLASGKVLAAGGFDDVAGWLASAELYDPASGTWAATGSMANQRSEHTATLLSNGKVLVAGGSGGSSPGVTAELYGPLPVADLTITKTDGQATASPSQTITYTIVGSNAGPTAVTGAKVMDTVPASLTGANWTCVPSGGATCTAGPVSGNINQTVNLPVGGTVTYTLTGQLSANPSGLSNTATIALPSGMYDPNTADNSATDTDLLLCGNETVVVPDGRLAMATIAAGATQWFVAQLKIGDSYSLEMKNVQADSPATSVAPGTLQVFSGDNGCSGTSTVALTHTEAADPGAAALVRVSFTAAGASPFFRAKLNNPSPDPITYTIGWSDTAMFSPTWSTNGGFDTYYSLDNTTGAAVSGVLILFEASGAVAGTSTMTIPAGQKMSVNTAGLGIARNRIGTARFTHDGPPGAVTVEAAVASFSIRPPYVQPVKFQPVRETR